MSFWKSPSSKIKIFRGAFGIVWIILNSKQWQNRLNKTKQKEKKRAEPPGLTCEAHLVAQQDRPSTAQPTLLLSSSSPRTEAARCEGRKTTGGLAVAGWAASWSWARWAERWAPGRSSLLCFIFFFCFVLFDFVLPLFWILNKFKQCQKLLWIILFG